MGKTRVTGLPPESLSDMIAPGQRQGRREQETRMGDKKKETQNARALVTLPGDRTFMVTLLTVANLRTNRPKAGTA